MYKPNKDGLITKLLIGGLYVLLACTSAKADIRATYGQSATRVNLTVEITDNGAMRFTRSDGSYIISVDGNSYLVEAGPGGPIATTIEAESYLRRQDMGSTSHANDKDSEKIRELVIGENTNIYGYDGNIYNLLGSKYPYITLTNDRNLQSLGNAVWLYFEISEKIYYGPKRNVGNLEEILAGKGVLALGQDKLIDLSFSHIDSSRFTVPAVPLTVADIEAADLIRNRNNTIVNTDTITNGAFLDGKLYTLNAKNGLEVRTEGSLHSSPIETPGFVHSICVLNGELFIITEKDDISTASLWSRLPNEWRLETEIVIGSKNYFVALDCSGEEPLLVTHKQIILPRSNRKRSINWGQIQSSGGFVKSLQHDGYLYLGRNTGEWGGGLIRIAMSNGRAEVIDASDPNELCGGILNGSCDPVTGLAPDPINPECVIATTGLVHFSSDGAILRICDKKITLAFAKPYTLESNWHFDTANTSEAIASVPYFSLGWDAGNVWVVGANGIYNFSDQQLPNFYPFPRLYRYLSSNIDWSNPEFILIQTDMNRRHSLSGGSLILVPR